MNADCSRDASALVSAASRLDCPAACASRNLFTPSFRNRLRLFFVVIVILPMIAVGFVLFQLVSRSEQSQSDAQLSEAQRVAQNLYRERGDARRHRRRADRRRRGAARGRSPTRTRARSPPGSADAARKAGARRVLLDLDGPGAFEFGTEPGVAPARNSLSDQDGKPLGRLVTVGRERDELRRWSSRTSPRSAW